MANNNTVKKKKVKMKRLIFHYEFLLNLKIKVEEII